jgi:hypothetical protein
VRVFAVFLVLVISTLFCGQPAEEWQLRGWTPTPPLVEPTQTPFIIVYTSTPVSTYTQLVKEVTSTPKPEYLCVVADEAVYLRPSASMDNYPISPLPNGARVLRLGGQKEDWIFVEYSEFSGWVHSEYLESCE